MKQEQNDDVRMPVVIEQVLVKKVSVFGNSAHVVVPRSLVGEDVFVLVVAKFVQQPLIHYGTSKYVGKKPCYEAEISDGGGTHRIWI